MAGRNLVARWAPVKLGLAMIGGGAYMASQGIAARKRVLDTLASERIVTGEDALIPGVLVTDVKTAEVQLEMVRRHTMRRTENRTMTEIPREDPLREYYFHSVTLQSALGLAIIGVKLSELVIGMGAFMAASGAAFVVLSGQGESTND